MPDQLDILTAIAHAVDRATTERPLTVSRVRNLAPIVEAFAAAHSNLDPDTHRALLVKLARALEPTTPPTLTAARIVLGPRRTTDQVLEEIRRHTEIINRKHPATQAFADAACDLAAAVERLDLMLSTGNLPPAVWTETRQRPAGDLTSGRTWHCDLCGLDVPSEDLQGHLIDHAEVGVKRAPGGRG